MITKEGLLNSLRMFKTQLSTIFLTIDEYESKYENVTEDEVHEIFVGIGTFSWYGSSDDSSSQFEIGMTWGEYINSSYNTFGFGTATETTDRVSYNGFRVVTDRTATTNVVLTDKVIDSYNYYILIEPA